MKRIGQYPERLGAGDRASRMFAPIIFLMGWFIGSADGVLGQVEPRPANPAGGAIVIPEKALQLQRVDAGEIQAAMQEMLQRRQQPAQQVEEVPVAEAQATEGQVDSSEKYPEGAMLSTNPDVMAILEKAERYQSEGNYRTAGRFWQAAMKQAGDTLFTDDGEFYYPLIRRVESIIAQLPPEGLEVYRVSADADAAGYLAEGRDGGQARWDALQKVVDFAFLSSEGDDAALELATYYLDRFEVYSAETLLNRIVESYPDPDVPLDEVWVKLAVARAIAGNADAAKNALKQAREVREVRGRSPITDATIQQVAATIDHLVQSRLTTETSDGNWTTPYGLGREIQQAPEIPAGYLDAALAPAWMYRQQLREWNVGPRDSHVQGTVERNPLEREDFLSPAGSAEAGTEAGESEESEGRRDSTRASIEREWVANGWQSASLPLVIDGQVVFKSQADLAVWSGELQPQPVFRSLWLNQYAPDPLTAQLVNQSRNIQGNFPGAQRLDFHNLETMQFFGDQLFQSMCFHNGVIYSIEGRSYNRDERMPSVVGRSINIWTAAPTRDRACVLVAYELSTGKALWNEPFPSGENSEQFPEAAILGPPIGYHDSLLVPVLSGGRYYVVALQARSGKMLWKQSVCDSATLSTSSLTMVQMALSGNDLYLTCGSGILARLNASTGQLVWVRRYRRSVSDQAGEQNRAVFGLNRDWMNKDVSGWKHDLVFVWGKWVVMAASDRDELMGFDRGTGEFVWMAPRSNVLGCTVDQWLGVKDGIMYATGPRGLLAYELGAQGRLYGTPQSLEQSVTGRGIVLEQGILLPVGTQIVQFDLRSLQPTGQTEVAMPGGAQLGTLVSDGQRLWSAAMGMLAALEPIQGPVEPAASEDPKSKQESDSDSSSEDDASPQEQAEVSVGG